MAREATQPYTLHPALFRSIFGTYNRSMTETNLPEKRPGGRPSTYTEELAAEICERLSVEEGGLNEVCKADDMPVPSTVYLWLTKHPTFSEMYARARENLGVYVAHLGVKEATGARDHQLGRLQFDARKWLASKLASRTFGDKTAIVGGDPAAGDKPIQVVDLTQATPEQLAALAGLKLDGE